MHKFMLVVCAVAGLAAGCGAQSPIAACNSFQVLVCARVYECYDGPTKASAAFVAMYGASQSECESKLKSANCATTTNDTLRSPLDATTPAVITELSLGTTGTSASSSASRKMIAYAHPDASDTSCVNWSNKPPA